MPSRAPRTPTTACAQAARPGPCTGVPIGVKDIIATRGVPTGMGSPIYADYVPEQNAEVVDRLHAAGAFAMGKTVTTEFAFLVPSKTRNPWNSAHTPGGSSSGSAAAVACGMAPAAIGTQTNGSIIRPAAFCGVVGYKPGKGVLSTDGILPFSPTLDQPGVFARSVEDAALLVAHLAHSRWTISPQISALKHAPRLVAVRTPVWHLASEDQRNRFAMDVAGLREAGAVIEEIELPGSFNDAHKVQRTIMLYEAAAGSRAVREAYAAKFSEFLRKALEEGDRISAAEYDRALKKKEALERDFSRFLDDFDAVITPPAAGEAPLAGDHRRSQLLHHLDVARRAGRHHSHRAGQPRPAAWACRSSATRASPITCSPPPCGASGSCRSAICSRGRRICSERCGCGEHAGTRRSTTHGLSRGIGGTASVSSISPRAQRCAMGTVDSIPCTQLSTT